jgi:hypothetical protein
MIKKITFLALALVVGLVSCDDILEVPDISEQSVTILAPKDGSVLDINAVNFNWETVKEATGYRIQIATPNFENAAQFVLDSVVEVDSLGYVTPRLEQNLLNGNYEWRIRAFNSDYETGYTLNAFSVNGDGNFDATPPNTPQLVAPVNGASQAETTVSFSWSRENVPGTAERDSIFIYTDESLSTLSTKALGANKSYETTLAAGTFYWYVKAYDAAGNESNASNTFNVTVTN